MRELVLTFNNLPPMPLNRTKTLVAPKGKRPMWIKTPLAREFEKDLSDRLGEFTSDINGFKDSFNKSNSYIDLTFLAYCPSKELFTSLGEISSRCPDFDSNKLMIDIIFGAVGIDDKFVKSANIKYLESSDEFWNFRIVLKSSPSTNLKWSELL